MAKGRTTVLSLCEREAGFGPIFNRWRGIVTKGQMSHHVPAARHSPRESAKKLNASENVRVPVPSCRAAPRCTCLPRTTLNIAAARALSPAEIAYPAIYNARFGHGYIPPFASAFVPSSPAAGCLFGRSGESSA